VVSVREKCMQLNKEHSLQNMHHGRYVTNNFLENIQHQQYHVKEQCSEQWKHFK
jgi:hypothetical protein